MLGRKILQKGLLIAAIAGVGVLLHGMMVPPLKCEIKVKKDYATHTTAAARGMETLQLSSEAKMKILRAMNGSELTTEMEEARPPFKVVLDPSKKIDERKTENDGVVWTAVNMIKSAVKNKDRRDVIRETWGSVHRWKDAQIITVFILGDTRNEEEQRNVEEEFSKFGDILQINVEENYRLISLKTLAGMQWAGEVLPSNWLYSSGDDDFVLHVGNFVRYIENTALRHSWKHLPLRKMIEYMPIICIYSYRTTDKPHRKNTSKWYISKKLYSPNYWPPYCRGGWYSATVATVSRLYDASRLSPFLHLDDVWITGIVRIRMTSVLEHVEDESLLTAAIIEAPLSKRSNNELLRNSYEEDLSKVLVSHKWGNIDSKHVNVTQSLKQTWEKWKTTIVDSN